MGFSYNRRISTGKGGSINVSKSGISVSQKTSWGSYGSRGFSIKSGMPGLNYRFSFKKKMDAATLVVTLMIGAIVLSIVIAYNGIRLLSWMLAKGYVLTFEAIKWYRNRKNQI
jgi:hypothetical protein